MPNKTVVITGAGKGIGRAIALKFAAENINLALLTRTESDYDSLKKDLAQYNIECLFFCGDVSKETDIDNFAKQAKDKFNQIDFVINNAGVFTKQNLVDSEVSEYDRVMNINVRGSYLISRSFLPEMIARQDGMIVFISSISGLMGFPEGSIYCASKHAIQGLAESLMMEVRESGIRVVSICPGFVNTPMMAAGEGNLPSPESVIQPEDIAESVYLACKMPKNTLIKQIELRSANPIFPEK